MGQYFKACIITDDKPPKVKWFMYSHLYDNGLKLMEHSYVGNGFVKAFEILLALDGPQRVVWAGDYADPEPGTEDNLYSMTNGTDGDEDFTMLAVVLTPDLFSGGMFSSQFGQEEKKKYAVNFWPPFLIDDAVHRYILNHDTQQYADKAHAPSSSWDPDVRIHPLPLLTCEGNNRGGGDYRSNDRVIGSWARDRISIGESVPEGYAELDFAGLLSEESNR